MTAIRRPPTSPGGRPHLPRVLLDATTGARGVLFELPDVIAAPGVEHERLRLRHS